MNRGQKGDNIKTSGNKDSGREGRIPKINLLFPLIWWMMNSSTFSIKLPFGVNVTCACLLWFGPVRILRNKSDMLLGRFCSDSAKIGALICHVKVKEQQVQRLSAQDTRGCATLQDTSALRRKHEALNTTGTDEWSHTPGKPDSGQCPKVRLCTVLVKLGRSNKNYKYLVFDLLSHKRLIYI